MKKLLFMLTLVMSVVLTSCKDDECDHNLSSSSGNDLEDTVVGNWYEEELNEEVHLGENGTFYDRFANYLRCAQTEGQYEYDSKNKKLTYRYLSMGQTRAIDWTVRNKSEMGFVISSPEQGEHKQEKIVEEYELKVGETVNIKFPTEYPDYSVISYASNNPRIASVTSEGGIKAEGEKGITYIKVSTTTCNVWVKVTVGDNCADLWHDYVGLLDLDYNGMRKALSMLGEPIALEDDYSFAFPHTMHDVADMTIATLCPEEGIVIQVQLWIKESVPEAEILSYLNSRYYKFAEVEGMIFYYSEAQVETSKSIIGYSRATKRLVFGQTEHALHPHVADLWPDFIPMFGNTKSQVKSTMDKKGFTFAMSDYEYSKNGSDYYLITGNEYAWLVGFVFNPDDQVCEFWVYMDRSTDPNRCMIIFAPSTMKKNLKGQRLC